MKRGILRLTAVLALGLLAAPLAGEAQPPERVRRVGVLYNIAESDPEAPQRVAAFQQGLQALGWTIGRNLRIEYRWGAGDPTRVRAHATALTRWPAEVIVGASSTVVVALRRETRSTPIVFVNVSEPVAQGFVTSLARPGGNVTGFSNIEPELGGKWLQILREVAPRVTRVALLSNVETAPYSPLFSRSMESAAPSLGFKLVTVPVRSAAEIEHGLDAFAREPGGALIPIPGPFFSVHRDLIIALAAKHRLPAVYQFGVFITRGGLLSYGDDPNDLIRRAAGYVDRILHGAQPADLPVQAPTKFVLAINLRTAKALGLTIPPSLLLRADQVIE